MKYLFCFSLLFAFNALAADDLEMSFSTNNFSLIDDFEVNVKNISSAGAQYFQVKVHQLIDKKWELTRTDASCTCGVKCKKSPTLLNSNDTKVEGWDFKNDNCNIVSLGKYQISIYGKNPEQKQYYKILGTSSTFTVGK